MVDAKQYHCFDKLCLNNGALYRNNRLTRENWRTLGTSPYVAGKFEILKIIKKLFVKTLSAKQSNIVFTECKRFEVFDKLLNTCHNRKTAAIGHGTVEHIENSLAVCHTVVEIALSHGQLVKIHKRRQIAASFTVTLECHNFTPLSKIYICKVYYSTKFQEYNHKYFISKIYSVYILLL